MIIVPSTKLGYLKFSLNLILDGSLPSCNVDRQIGLHFLGGKIQDIYIDILVHIDELYEELFEIYMKSTKMMKSDTT